jgi:hypothetical protein
LLADAILAQNALPVRNSPVDGSRAAQIRKLSYYGVNDDGPQVMDGLQTNKTQLGAKGSLFRLARFSILIL